MGDVSDIGDLLAKALREKRLRVVWALGTAVATVVCTTATVSWQVRGYVAAIEHKADELRSDLRVYAKDIEQLQEQQREDKKELAHIRERADSALLIAQLAKSGVVKP